MTIRGIIKETVRAASEDEAPFVHVFGLAIKREEYEGILQDIDGDDRPFAATTA